LRLWLLGLGVSVVKLKIYLFKVRLWFLHDIRDWLVVLACWRSCWPTVLLLYLPFLIYPLGFSVLGFICDFRKTHLSLYIDLVYEVAGHNNQSQSNHSNHCS
jgi:hypothetical protein